MTEIDTRFFETAEKPNIKHNWLYSIVPQFNIDPLHQPAGIYLVAYCKNDRKYITVLLQTDQMVDFVIERTAAIPVWGCEPSD